MKITFEETSSRKQWIHKELLHSLDFDTINNTKNDAAYDVKLLVNGKELEPKFFNYLVENINKYIDDRAKELINDKLWDAKMKADKVYDVINKINDDIREEFNISDDY